MKGQVPFWAGAGVALQNARDQLRRQNEEERRQEEKREKGDYRATKKELKGKKEGKIYYEYDPMTRELRKNLDLSPKIKYRKIGWVFERGNKYLYSIDYVNKKKKLAKVV